MYKGTEKPDRIAYNSMLLETINVHNARFFISIFVISDPFFLTAHLDHRSLYKSINQWNNGPIWLRNKRNEFEKDKK